MSKIEVIVKIDGEGQKEMRDKIDRFFFSIDYTTNELANYYRHDGSRLFKHDPETCAMIRKYREEQGRPPL